MSIEWERHAAYNGADLILRCDHCVWVHVESMSARMMHDYGKLDLLAMHASALGFVYEDQPGDDCCPECWKVEGEKQVETLTASDDVLAAGLSLPAEATFTVSYARTLNDLIHGSMIMPYIAESAFLRDAMAGMANVMGGVAHALVEFTANVNLAFMLQQRYDMPVSGVRDKEAASREWSRRVREGVAKLKQPGPVVTCQSEED